MVFNAFFLWGLLLLGLLLSSMGVPFEDVVLTLVALPLLALFGLLVLMQLNENRIQKRFADEAPRRSRRSRWYSSVLAAGCSACWPWPRGPRWSCT